MERQSAIAEIKRAYKARDYLTPSKNGLYCCPECNSGHGKNRTGAVKVYDDTNTWYCNACGAHGDVIDLIQREMPGTEFNELIDILASDMGITIDQYSPPKPAGAPERDVLTQRANILPLPAKEPETGTEEPTDNTAYYSECRERLDDPEAVEYLRSRGLSLETAKAYWLGYDPAADPAGAGHPRKRIIIPTTTTHYIGRAIDGIKDRYEKINNKGGRPGVFNEKALYAQGVQEVFITEGAIDALSIIEIGPAAIALNSTANAEMLIKKLEQRKTTATLILCLDNDDAGRKAAETLKAGLQRLNISYTTANICGACKDPNEALTTDREAFKQAIEGAQRAAGARPDNTSIYIDQLMKHDIERFNGEVKTGFNNLDDLANGLYPGLYVLAAISSLGKTSLALQLADQLAAGGQEVIYFSMEQSRLEMVSKSLARITAQEDIKEGITSLQIRKGYQTDKVQRAAEKYKQTVSDRLSIVEGNFNCNISFIGDYLRQYIARNKTRPIVFIDYLQILQPAPEIRRQTTKEVIDMAVTDLKRLSREMDITIIVISSINRGNYLTPINFESLKESGGIEYTADVILGLQLKCITSSEFKRDKDDRAALNDRIREAKAATPRELELVCIKNRYGRSSYSCYFKYYPANDLFIEDGSSELETVPTRFVDGPIY